MKRFEEDDPGFHLRPKRARKSRFRPLNTKRNHGGYAHRVRAWSPRCTVSLSFARAADKSHRVLSAHVEYLNRESASVPGSSLPRTLGTTSLEAFGKFLPGEKRIFRMVVSPENFFEMDPGAFAFAYMDEVFRRAGRYVKGQTADWAAAVHYNTANPHFHFLVRGITDSGRDFLLSKDLVKNLHKIAAEVQNNLSGGRYITEPVYQERRAASSTARMRKILSIDIEAEISQLRAAVPYKEFLSRFPSYRRHAVHSRLVVLQNLDLVSLVDGTIVKAHEFDAQWKRIRHLVANLSKHVRYCRPESLLPVTRGFGSSIGLVTNLVRNADGMHYAILETLDMKCFAVPIDESSITQLRLDIVDRTPRELQGIDIGPVRGDPFQRIRKLRSRGPVFDVLSRRTTGDVRYDSIRDLQSPNRGASRDGWQY